MFTQVVYKSIYFKSQLIVISMAGMVTFQKNAEEKYDGSIYIVCKVCGSGDNSAGGTHG